MLAREASSSKMGPVTSGPARVEERPGDRALLVCRQRARRGEDLARRDPDVLATVEDIDRTLIWEAMHEAPLARLARCAQQARLYARLRVSA